MRQLIYGYLVLLTAATIGCTSSPTETTTATDSTARAGNPVFDGWYADPEGIVFGDEYWIYPTYSAAFEEQTFMDAFSSSDLVNWQKHSRIIDTTAVKWARQAMWAPAAIEKDGQYFLFFAANDVQRPGRPFWDENNDINHFGGIGVGVADSPAGPFRDYLGEPLIADFYNDAQPIDQFVFEDTDGTYYIFYGGWGHCNLGKLNDDFTALLPWNDSAMVKEITPEGYVEGPFVFLRNEQYYFMWSEGNWTDSTYTVAYAIADQIDGPYQRMGTILSSEPGLATGAGHNSALRVPGTDEWYMVYHRRPIPNEGRDHRVTCIDRLSFNDDGTIQPVKMTREGVQARPIIK
ncbi:glycoside hydrolase family 43 protein [Tunicatimonas pelagia]|uniref:glycoside hydrolase family 43 protein n=1 Tax=Tunicatimonas pelagia TaxID=931531 RepID=UPI002666E1C0|nr:glycoside hydrolase family 43 protein [Tunicatimonas pelagia]WKN45774.1 glycoside hydrolase family 43 protein [Tunicatimonas pelagia]